MDDLDDGLQVSMAKSIRNLGIGECYSRSIRFDLDCTTKDDLMEANHRLRQTVDAPVKRAAHFTGAKYTLELGEWRTKSRDLVLTALVTRVE